jgi:hypothetical protein
MQLVQPPTVRLFSALRATSYLKLLKALRMSFARFTRSPEK